MTKTIIAVLTILLSTNVAFSQNQSDNSDIDIALSLFGKGKRLIIEEYMDLDTEEKSFFWPVYDEYEEKRKRIEKQGFLLLDEYSTKYHTLNDADAHRLIKNFMKSMDAYSSLQKVYFRKLEKKIGSLKAAKFIQLETFIQTTAQATVQSQVPVIGELDRLEEQKAATKMAN